jgi:DNA-binding NtrC family response regulator
MKNESRRRILVIDDDRAMREMLIALLEDAGHEALGAEGVDVAVEHIREETLDAVISDIRMPGRSGLDILGEVRELQPDLPVIMMTAFGSIDSAVEAMQAGAFDYVTKPFKRDAILVPLERAFEKTALEAENKRLRRALDRTTSFGELIGASPSMREIFALIRKVADRRVHVLITGESGTGKEIVARSLHFAGGRADKPFIPINCTALPEGLMESELFGHVRGAFTGASSNKRGLFEEADGGTLFLDEIGDMTLPLQSKLLRVLQDREVRPVGGNQARAIDVRLIAATNRDLQAEIEAGRFRKDLFYRLNVIPVHIPPLRERPEDIELLARTFLERHGEGRFQGFTPTALERLRRSAWPGNGRELENVIERAVALAEHDVIDAADLPIEFESRTVATRGLRADDLADRALQEGLTLAELSDLYTERVLEYTGGNKARAAQILGINRRTLYRRGFGPSEQGHVDIEASGPHRYEVGAA